MITEESWVFDGSRIGKVKAIWPDCNGSGVTYDIVLYSRFGDRIGRESPAMGGPRGFEPCCAAEHWKEIERPLFPLEKYTPIGELVKPR